jgi:cytochrome c oxidase subunit 1/cytochrome c oxidase subunit I+III
MAATLSREAAPPPPSAPSSGGLWRWVATVDHKDIGIMYLVASVVFLLLGGAEAELIRLQLAQPGEALVSPAVYAQLFTMHGTTMIFLVAMPALFGFANFIVPLQIGARDMVFPRLNAFSFWLLAFGGILLYYSFLAGSPPAQMWFMYPPLTEPPFSLDLGPVFWATGLLATSIGSIATSINLVVTIATLRAPGMTIGRLPLFTWTVLGSSIIVIYALPLLAGGQVMLLADRLLGTHFFSPAGGGDPILWEHIFWSFGHPEVYVVILPAFGMISETIPVFSRKSIFGHSFVAASTMAIVFLSFLVWAHHMFTSGLGDVPNIFFTGASMLIAVPTGVKIFNWIGTMWRGSIRYTVSMLFSVGLIANFIIGGLTGPMLAAAPVDQQVHDSYFVVAHMHYVLFGGVVFGIFAASYFWFPKITGRLLSERIGLWHFWTMIVGLNLTFFPQHFLGLIGMPRHFYTYPDLPGWASLNLVSTIGAVIMGVSGVIFLWNVLASLLRGEIAGGDPWDAYNLEWSTSSPPPAYNFATIPVVHGRRAWLLEKERIAAGERSPAAVEAPGHPVAPRDLGPLSGMDVNQLGVLVFASSEAFFFLVLISSYIYGRPEYTAANGPTPQAALNIPLTAIFTVFLLASSLTMSQATARLGRGELAAARRWLGITVALGAIFLAGQIYEYAHLYADGIPIDRNLWSSAFFTLTGFHGAHVLIGLTAILIATSLLRARPGEIAGARGLEAVSIYWHFVDLVWVVIFPVVYLWTLLS